MVCFRGEGVNMCRVVFCVVGLGCVVLYGDGWCCVVVSYVGLYCVCVVE